VAGCAGGGLETLNLEQVFVWSGARPLRVSMVGIVAVLRQEEAEGQNSDEWCDTAKVYQLLSLYDDLCSSIQNFSTVVAP